MMVMSSSIVIGSTHFWMIETGSLEKKWSGKYLNTWPVATALIFHTETASRMTGSGTCTQNPQWVIPTYQKDIPYAPLCKLDFSSAKSKKHRIDSAIVSTIGSSMTTATAPVKDVVKRDHQDQDLQSFYLQISKCSSKPAILSLVPQHAQDFIPKSTLPNFPKPLQSLHLSSFHQLSCV